jgi:hypothetical protein
MKKDKPLTPGCGRSKKLEGVGSAKDERRAAVRLLISAGAS